MRIKTIHTRILYNNRLEHAVEVVINDTFRGLAPAGASKGSNELKDKDPLRYKKKAEEMLKKYIGEKLDFNKIDREIKFIKHKLGSNFSTAFSFALFNANFHLKDRKYVFPLPLSNVIGGGMHLGNMNIQEMLVIPKRKKRTFKDAFEINRTIYLELKDILKRKGMLLGYNDESALITKLNDIKALDLLSSLAESKGAYVGVDMASNSYYDTSKNIYKFNGKTYRREEYIEFVSDLIEKYNIRYVEDPLNENDFEGFAYLKKKHKKTIICGDDLTTTNPKRLNTAIKNNAISGIIIKPNQIGTISEALEVKEVAEKNNIIPIISHRSGEGDDYTISRLAVEYGFPIAKFGISGMRIVKINELIRLWDIIDKKEVANPWEKLRR